MEGKDGKIEVDIRKKFLILWITKASIIWQHLAWRQGAVLHDFLRPKEKPEFVEDMQRIKLPGKQQV
jgi:hypothetical protein